MFTSKVSWLGIQWEPEKKKMKVDSIYEVFNLTMSFIENPDIFILISLIRMLWDPNPMCLYITV